MRVATMRPGPGDAGCGGGVGRAVTRETTERAPAAEFVPERIGGALLSRRNVVRVMVD
jgi:hypothetical protein